MQSDSYKELMKLGSQLSLELGCPIKYPVTGKNEFICKCGVRFLVSTVKSGDWDKIRKMHKEGSKQ